MINPKDICEKYKISWNFIKFILVGILNTIFGYSIFAICNFLGFHYTLSTLITTILGVLFNFKTTGIIVFLNNDNKKLLRFIAVYCFNYIWANGILYELEQLNYINMYIKYAIPCFHF